MDIKFVQLEVGIQIGLPNYSHKKCAGVVVPVDMDGGLDPLTAVPEAMKQMVLGLAGKPEQIKKYQTALKITVTEDEKTEETPKAEAPAKKAAAPASEAKPKKAAANKKPAKEPTKERVEVEPSPEAAQEPEVLDSLDAGIEI